MGAPCAELGVEGRMWVGVRFSTRVWVRSAPGRSGERAAHNSGCVHSAVALSYLDSPKPQYTVLEEYGARQVLHVVQSAVLAWHW